MIAEIEMGQSPQGNSCNEEGNGVPLLNGPTEFSAYHPNPVQFTIDPKKYAYCHDILFCVRGSTTGRMNWADRKYAIGRGIAALRHKDGDNYRYFLKALIDFHLPTLLTAATGSTFPNVSKVQLNDLVCKVPPLPEQRAIAHILGTLNDKIELNRQMHQTLEAMARAIFKSWFVDFDPVRAKAGGRDPGLPPDIAALFPDRFEDSELGPIPKGWKVDPLAGIAVLKMQTIQPNNEPNKKWEHYSIPAFDEGKTPKIDKGKNIKSGKYSVPEYSVLASKLNPQFPRVWLPDVQNSSTAICSTEFMPFVPLKRHWRPFLFEMLKSRPIQEEILNRATGSTGSRQRVKPKDIALMHVLIPPESTIQAFSEKIGALHERMLKNIGESDNLETIRYTLLPRLLSGEIQVPEAEKFVKEISI